MSRVSASGLAACGVAGLLAAAVARSVTSLAAWRWFDVDPLLQPGAFEGLGPAASMALDAMLLASAALVLVAAWCRARRLDVVSLLLILAPVPVLIWHGADDLEQAWRGSSLAAGWLALVAAAHLREFPRHRVVLAAGLLAAAAPWVARGAEQWFIDHPATVAHFQQHRGEVLASLGFPEDSVAARGFERRLMRRAATGWFGMANVWSALLAAAAVAWSGILIATRTRAIAGGTRLLAAAAAVAAIVGVIANGSKGAIVALLAGGVFVVVGLRSRRSEGGGNAEAAASRVSSWMVAPSRLALAAIPLGILAIVARGLLPEGLLGEISLLFRWHYLEAAVATLSNHPLGVGPAGFQDAFVQLKSVRNPEEVQSAHGLFADAAIAVGWLAVPWMVALVRLLWRRESDEVPGELDRPRDFAIVVAATAVAVVTMAAGAPMALGVEEMPRWIAVFVSVPLAIAGISMLRAVSTSVLDWVLAAAAFTLLLQGQIEMTFFNQGSIAWAMLLLGLAGSAGVRPAITGSGGVAGPRCRGGWVLALVPMALAAAVLAVPTRAAWRNELGLAEAAAPLESLARLAASDPTTPPTRDAVLAARRLTADRLEALMATGGPAAARVGEMAFEARLNQAVGESDPAAMGATFAAALARAEANLEDFGDSPRRLADRVRALRAWRKAQQTAVGATKFAEAIRAALVAQPYAVSLWIDLGDACAEAGDADAARAAWRRGLELDAELALDPLAQLPEPERRAIEAKVAP